MVERRLFSRLVPACGEYGSRSFGVWVWKVAGVVVAG